MLGTLQSLLDQQRRDLTGFGRSDGMHDESARADVDSANSQLAEAQYAFGRAIGMLGGERGEWIELEAWGFSPSTIHRVGELFDLLRAERNVAIAKQLHLEIRRLFLAIYASDPNLRDVSPLANWDADEELVEDAREMWFHQKRSVVLAAILISLFLLGLAFGLG